jgi:hypothetical protein
MYPPDDKKDPNKRKNLRLIKPDGPGIRPGQNLPHMVESQIMKPDLPIKEDTTSNLDMITVLTMLMSNKQKFGCTFGEKYLKIQYSTPKDTKEKIETFYEKNKAKNEDSINEDSTMD